MHWIDLSAVVICPEIISQISATDAASRVIPVTFGESGVSPSAIRLMSIPSIASIFFSNATSSWFALPEKIRQALIKYYGTAEETADVPA